MVIVIFLWGFWGPTAVLRHHHGYGKMGSWGWRPNWRVEMGGSVVRAQREFAKMIMAHGAQSRGTNNRTHIGHKLLQCEWDVCVCAWAYSPYRFRIAHDL